MQHVATPTRQSGREGGKQVDQPTHVPINELFGHPTSWLIEVFAIVHKKGNSVRQQVATHRVDNGFARPAMKSTEDRGCVFRSAAQG
jgi:hypothetical protein